MDPGDDVTALRLRSYLWPDQRERRARLDSAIETARAVPATVVQTDDTGAALTQLLDTVAGRSPTLVFHSIVWPRSSGRLLAHADFHGRWVRTLPE